ncbi:hypothetical protein K450DRAFT_262634 [Umbelopsis ramanniana AG]|uniref:Uncharacterized protein n=1 Tax=Umbelopsis ramanniana AG TaxID=1314678 RepID=A0AAD5H9X3_UMBRA|nr:uncharacterized protein K450DRAFT_262634 [Umbelopsis ramanniana AG]KAI8575249.1 hypothetical protein K450DRAFT_262634 [Umbelopsis ramanniana AG]
MNDKVLVGLLRRGGESNGLFALPYIAGISFLFCLLLEGKGKIAAAKRDGSAIDIFTLLCFVASSCIYTDSWVLKLLSGC